MNGGNHRNTMLEDQRTLRNTTNLCVFVMQCNPYNPSVMKTNRTAKQMPFDIEFSIR